MISLLSYYYKPDSITLYDFFIILLLQTRFYNSMISLLSYYYKPDSITL